MARARRFLSGGLGVVLGWGCADASSVSGDSERVGITTPPLEQSESEASPSSTFELDCAAPVWWASDLLVVDTDEARTFCESANAVEGSVYLYGDVVTELDCLCEVGGDLVVAGVRIQNVVFPQLSRVGGAVVAQNLPDLEGLVLPTLVELGGDLSLDTLDALREVHFEQLPAVGGMLSVREAAVLELLRLPNLTHASSLELEDLGLSYLDGLASFESVDGVFGIVGLATLSDLDGLGQVSHIGGDLMLLDNPGLSADVVEGFITRVGRENIGGEVVTDHKDEG